MAKERYELVYEWNLAYRINHWVRAIAIFVLIFTGYYIYAPFIPGSEGGYLMSWMRFLHFLSMYILILSLIAYIYFNDIGALLPRWSLIRDIPDILGYYLFLKDTHKDYERFNPLQALTYFVWGLLIIVQIFTGFALYSGSVFGLFDSQAAFGWVNRLLGGMPVTRLIHFAVMWIFIITIPVHIYMGILKDLTDRDRTFTSIFTGYKLKKVRGSQ